MPRGRKAKPPRLYLRERSGRDPVWVILDNGKEQSTEAGLECREQAEKALADYIARKYEAPIGPNHPDHMTIDRALEIYAEEHAPSTAAPELIAYHIQALCPFWGDQMVSAIKGETCRAYVKQRKVKPSTSRRELETLSAAINYCHKEGYLIHVPRITKPPKPEARERWLTKREAAALLRAARAHPYVADFILVGLYTGTRSAAILGLQWLPNTTGGWIDLDRGLLYRGAVGRVESNKRQPTCSLPTKLIAHLRRVRKRTRRYVIEYEGEPLKRMKRAWHTARKEAGLGKDVTPHVLRHTAVTWRLQAGVDPYEVAGYVGMSVKMVLEHYGHHCPDHQQRARDAI